MDFLTLLGNGLLRQLGSPVEEQLIRKGGTSVVKKITNKRTGLSHIVKISSERVFDRYLKHESQVLLAFHQKTRGIFAPQIPAVLSYQEGNRHGEQRAKITYPYIPGCDFSDYLRRPSTAKISRIGSSLCSLLEVLHSNSVFHRDVKPENLFLPDEGCPVILFDYGFSYCSSVPDIVPEKTFCATPWYASPEQARQEFADDKSDTFNVAFMMYECLMGNHPLGKNNAEEIIYQIQRYDETQRLVLTANLKQKFSEDLAAAWSMAAHEKTEARHLRPLHTELYHMALR